MVELLGVVVVLVAVALVWVVVVVVAVVAVVASDDRWLGSEVGMSVCR